MPPQLSPEESPSTDKFDVCSYRLFYAYITQGANLQRVNIHLTLKFY